MATRYLTRQQVRHVDRVASEQYGMSTLVLMENAGRACTDVLCELGVHGPVLILCGKGNNGGDGLVIARQLDARGHTPLILLAGPASALQGDAAANLAIVQHAGLPLRQFGQKDPNLASDDWFQQADWIVDALLGTGAKGAPREPAGAMIRRANLAPGRRLAIDLPSGLDCDTGEPAGDTFRAEATCTLVAEKAGFRSEAARPFLGAVHVLDIGTPKAVLDTALGP